MSRAFACLLGLLLCLVPRFAIAAETAGVFFDAPLEPPAGRIIHGWGQFSSAWDLNQPAGAAEEADLKDYIKSVAPNEPAMLSFYVASDFKILPAFLNRYRKFVAGRGFFVAEVGFNFRGMEHDVATGMKDPELWGLADGLKEAGRPVLLRIGYEFNKPGALYEPSGYIGGFRHMAEVMRKDSANVATVWNATAAGMSGTNYMKWYPGDDVVDWWGIDLFDPNDFTSPATTAFIENAARHHKPVLIGAASPVFQAGKGSVRGPRSDAEATKWYAALFEFIRSHPQVKAFSLVAADWRLNRWPGVASLVKKQLSDPRFVNAADASSVLHREGQP